MTHNMSGYITTHGAVCFLYTPMNGGIVLLDSAANVIDQLSMERTFTRYQLAQTLRGMEDIQCDLKRILDSMLAEESSLEDLESSDGNY
jgi:hypothetical protein